MFLKALHMHKKHRYDIFKFKSFFINTFLIYVFYYPFVFFLHTQQDFSVTFFIEKESIEKKNYLKT